MVIVKDSFLVTHNNTAKKLIVLVTLHYISEVPMVPRNGNFFDYDFCDYEYKLFRHPCVELPVTFRCHTLHSDRYFCNY